MDLSASQPAAQELERYSACLTCRELSARSLREIVLVFFGRASDWLAGAGRPARNLWNFQIRATGSWPVLGQNPYVPACARQ